jgi:hypothetical protein
VREGGARRTRPEDGEIKGREVRRVAVVLFQGIMAHFREVQGFAAPRGDAAFSAILDA